MYCQHEITKIVDKLVEYIASNEKLKNFKKSIEFYKKKFHQNIF